MEKKELTERLARETKLPPASAADELDNAVHDVLRSLKRHERPRATALQRLIDEARCAPERGRR